MSLFPMNFLSAKNISRPLNLSYKNFIFARNCPTYGALPFTGWGRLVLDGYGYAMHVRALLTHPLGLTLQPTPTICRSLRAGRLPRLDRSHLTRRRPWPRPSAGQLTAPLPAVTVNRPPTTPVRGYIWSKFKRMKSLIQTCLYNA